MATVCALACAGCLTSNTYGVTSDVTATLAVTPSSLRANGLAAATATVHLKPPLPGVVLALAGDTVRITPAQAISDAQGMAIFEVRSQRVGTYQLTPQALVPGHALALAAPILVTFQPQPGAATTLSLDGVPSSLAAGQLFSIRLRALDGNGLLDPNYLGSIHFSCTDAAMPLPADYTFTAADAGMHVFAAVHWNTAGPQVLAASDGALGSPSVAAQVQAGPAAALAVAGVASSVVAGQASPTLRVVAVDAFGNIAPSYSGTVHFSSSDAQAVLPANVTLTASNVGISAPQSVILKTAGEMHIAATDVERSALLGSTQVQVQAGSADSAQTQLTCSVGATAADGYSAARLTVSMRDMYGNPVADQAVSLTVDGFGNRLAPAAGATDSNGVFAATLASTVAESKNVRAQVGGQNLSCGLSFAAVACPAFAPTAALPVGTAAQASALGDLNGDGTLDLLVANAGNSFSVLLGTAGLGYAAANTVALMGAPHAVALGDMNRDGKLDALLTLHDGNTLALLWGNGDGTLQAPTFYAAGNAPEGLALVDLDRDGRLDAVVAASGDGNVMVLHGQSDGHLAAAQAYAAGPGIFGLAAADMNHDGKIDVAVAGNGTVYVLTNQGSSLAAPSLYPVAPGAHGLLAADLNGDGAVDLAVAHGQGVALLMSQSGSFATPVNIAVAGAWGLASGDLNGDGKPDLVATAQDQSTVLLNQGAGSFAHTTTLATPGAPGMPQIADVDRDGRVDILLPWPDANAVGLAFNACTGAKTCGAVSFAGGVAYGYQSQGATNVSTADFNGDGRVDVAALVGNNVLMLLNQGNGVLAPGVAYAMSGTPRGMAVADLNRDGLPDVAAISQASGLCVLLNQGNGVLAAPVLYSTSQQPWVLSTADINGDGAPDLIDGRRFGADVGLYVNHGDGSFAARVPFFFHASISGIATGDINRDGAADLILTTNQLAIALNAGGGTFAVPTNYAVGTYPLQVGVADLNGDGALDVVNTDNADNTVSLSLSTGDRNGTLRARQAWPTGNGPVGVALGDLNGDGWVDVVTASQTGNAATVLLNQGQAVLAAPQAFAAGPAFDVTLADLDNDGRLDMVVSNAATPAVTVLLNQCH